MDMIKFIMDYTANGYIVDIHAEPVNNIQGITISLTNPLTEKTASIFTDYGYIIDDKWDEKKKVLFRSLKREVDMV